MASWRLLTEFLNRIDVRVTLTWPELDEIVGGMPDSATDFSAWWSGHAHVNSWRSAGFDFMDLRRGSRVTFYRTGPGDTISVLNF